MPNVGTAIILQASFVDRTGIPTNPGSVTGKVLCEKTGIETTVAFQQASVGVWEAHFIPVDSGHHVWRIAGSIGLTVTSEKRFYVDPQEVL